MASEAEKNGDENRDVPGNPNFSDTVRPKFPKKEPARMTETLEKREEGGFFSIYKRGHGYRTRLLTFVAGLLLAGTTAYFIYTKSLTMASPQAATVIGFGFFILIALLVHWVTNRPKNAEFLIATDGEMKKVNWTSRADLIGATKVVIGFMVLIAIFLFIIDQLFAIFFYLIGIVHVRPPILG